MAFFNNGSLKYKSILGTYPILKQLIWLALPVIGSSFMTMAYNFINMIFVGSLGSNAVAAVGSAGFFMNLSWGLVVPDHGRDRYKGIPCHW